jgi:regulatory protein
LYKKYLTREEAIQKLKHYCGYQERCHNEVKQKLWDLGVRSAEHDDIVSALIEGDYLNEERFAKQYAGGKFRMNDWGRKKIYFGLKEKGISDYLIKKAMKEIDEEVYAKTLKQLTEKKYAALKAEQYLVRRKKTIDYLLQKGYEPDLITGAVNNVAKKE